MARPTTPGDGRRRRGRDGFTLIELVVVVTLISILAAIALPNFKVAITQAREATLKEDLYRLRDLIDQYYVDKGQYPASLDVLVEEGYLRKLPVDPFTGAPDWTAVYAEPDPDRPSEQPGVYDVKSASELQSLSGTPYNEW